MAAKSKRLLDTQTLETLDDIARGCRALRRCCGNMRMIHDTVGDPPLRRREAGFPGLARIVVGQQLSIASADAIWTRARSAIEPFEPEALLRCNDVELRTIGLSRPKIKTLRAIAAATLAGEICFETLSAVSEDELRQRLTAVPGVGPWSADIYLMFCRGARDAFAPSDLALQEAARLALSRNSRPHPNELLDIAERWRPWRGVAARLLWHYYAHQRALAKTSGGNNRRRAAS
jgi:DNA-3-methyladenine glycosylase II